MRRPESSRPCRHLLQTAEELPVKNAFGCSSFGNTIVCRRAGRSRACRRRAFEWLVRRSSSSRRVLLLSSVCARFVRAFTRARFSAAASWRWMRGGCRLIPERAGPSPASSAFERREALVCAMVASVDRAHPGSGTSRLAGGSRTSRLTATIRAGALQSEGRTPATGNPRLYDFDVSTFRRFDVSTFTSASSRRRGPGLCRSCPGGGGGSAPW